MSTASDLRRKAKAEGRVFVSVQVHGCGANSPGTGNHPIGDMKLQAVREGWQSFVLWMAAKGLTPKEIENECSRFGIPLPSEVRNFGDGKPEEGAMAQGEFTKQETKETQKAVDEMFKALGKKKAGFLGHYNDISLFLAAAEKAAPEGKG